MKSTRMFRQRIYRLKVMLVALSSFVAGVALLTFAKYIDGKPAWAWLAFWPIGEIGATLTAAGLFGIVWDYVDASDKDAREDERIRRLLKDAAPEFRDAVITGFVETPDQLRGVATSETLDKLVTNGLALRLGDAEFAREVYADLELQAIGVPERLRDARVSIRLSRLPASSTPAQDRATLLGVTMRWEFKLQPVFPSRRFISTSDLSEFRDLKMERDATSVWYFKPTGPVHAGAKESFELVDFTVGGEPRPIRRTTRVASQSYRVSLGAQAMAGGEAVSIAYTIRTVTAVAGHRLRLRVDQPTKGLTVDLDYSDTDLSEVAVLDYTASGGRSLIRHSPDGLPDKTVTLGFDGWLFPRSGVAFVWD